MRSSGKGLPGGMRNTSSDRNREGLSPIRVGSEWSSFFVSKGLWWNLVDTLVLGTSAARRRGSSPLWPTLGTADGQGLGP